MAPPTLDQPKLNTPVELSKSHQHTSHTELNEIEPGFAEEMASIDVLTTRFYSYDKMYLQESREQSFVDWPFREECNCTPEKMAKAGFVHCPSQNEPDVACCFFCLIELEGWEPDDDPCSEHMKRSPNCGFLTMKKDFTELTVAEFYLMEKERLKVFYRRVCHKKMACLRDDIDQTLEHLKSQLDSI